MNMRGRWGGVGVKSTGELCFNAISPFLRRCVLPGKTVPTSVEVLQTSRDSDSVEVWAGMSTAVDTVDAVDASTSGSEQHCGNDLNRISMSTNLPV